MKELLLAFVFVLSSTSLLAAESEEIISKTPLHFRSKVDSYLRINKLDRFYALIATKRDRRGQGGCSIHRGTMSSKRCRVTTEKVRIPNLEINEKNEAIYDNGVIRVECGYLKDTWLGRKIKFNNKCKLVDYEVIVEEDDGIDINRVKYSVTKFFVSED